MGFNDGRIILNNDSGTYTVGETIEGRIVFDQRKPLLIYGISVRCKSFCKVHWTTVEKRKEGDKKVEHMVDHEAYEEYFNQEFQVFGDARGQTAHELAPGHHEYGFECPIPKSCPSSFEGTHGHIRYQVKAVMVISENTSKEKLTVIRVMSPVDLNQNPYCKEPLEISIKEKYLKCCCLGAGSAKVFVKLPRGGFIPGKSFDTNLSLLNTSNARLRFVFCITKMVQFKTASQEKTETEMIALGGTPYIKHGQAVEIELTIPEMDIYNLNGCRFINIDYKFTVVLRPTGWHMDTVHHYPIILGTVPLESNDDDANPNESPDQPMPNVLYTNYPQNTPYPGAVPYPAPQMMPHPVSPYPPYPTYPVNSPVYPVANPSPAPTTNTNITVNLVAPSGGSS